MDGRLVPAGAASGVSPAAAAAAAAGAGHLAGVFFFALQPAAVYVL